MEGNEGIGRLKKMWVGRRVIRGDMKETVMDRGYVKGKNKNLYRLKSKY